MTENETSPDRANVVIRPPILYLGALVVGFVIDWFFPYPSIADGYQYLFGGALIALGIMVMMASMREFRNADTTIPTDEPTSAIVRTGPYAISRNPIYIALSALYLGISVGADNIWAAVLLAPVLMVIRYGVIAREEEYLEEKFGDDYRDYKTSVRRWL